jgi:hypothetical protein
LEWVGVGERWRKTMEECGDVIFEDKSRTQSATKELGGRGQVTNGNTNF